MERVDEYRMDRRLLMAELMCMAGKRETEVRLDRWCEGDLGQQRNDGGGYVSMRKRSERVLSPGTYVTE